MRSLKVATLLTLLAFPGRASATFISADPKYLPDEQTGAPDLHSNNPAFNRYIYANDNPLTFVDPNGEASCLPTEDQRACVERLNVTGRAGESQFGAPQTLPDFSEHPVDFTEQWLASLTQPTTEIDGHGVKVWESSEERSARQQRQRVEAALQATDTLGHVAANVALAGAEQEALGIVGGAAAGKVLGRLGEDLAAPALKRAAAEAEAVEAVAAPGVVLRSPAAAQSVRRAPVKWDRVRPTPEAIAEGLRGYTPESTAVAELVEKGDLKVVPLERAALEAEYLERTGKALGKDTSAFNHKGMAFVEQSGDQVHLLDVLHEGVHELDFRLGESTDASLNKGGLIKRVVAQDGSVSWTVRGQNLEFRAAKAESRFIKANGYEPPLKTNREIQSHVVRSYPEEGTGP